MNDPKPSDPKRHILRSPLPWRPDERYTECGKAAADFATVVSVDDARRFLTDWGQERFLFSFCATCRSTTNSWPTFHQSPSGRVAREANRGMWSPEMGTLPIDDELRALALLAEAHPEQFTSALEGMRTTQRIGAVKKARVR